MCVPCRPEETSSDGLTLLLICSLLSHPHHSHLSKRGTLSSSHTLCPLSKHCHVGSEESYGLSNITEEDKLVLLSYNRVSFSVTSVRMTLFALHALNINCFQTNLQSRQEIAAALTGRLRYDLVPVEKFVRTILQILRKLF